MVGDFNYIFSLGGSCDAASQIQKRGLRRFSTPLDWIGMIDERAIRYLPVGFRTRFADFCKRENLREHQRPSDGRESGWAPFCYDDLYTGWIFIHHFMHPISEPGRYEDVIATFHRRFERFFNAIGSAESVLFVLETLFPYDIGLADAVFESISALWPGKHIALRVMQFSATSDFADPKRFSGGGFYQYKRMRNMYDFSKTNWEWNFLDGFVREKVRRKPTGVAKGIYKVGKGMLNFLRHHGYDV